MNDYNIITKIQLTTENPYKLIATYNFLYSPLKDSKLIIDGNTHLLETMFDRIDEKGNIVRYIRYF